MQVGIVYPGDIWIRDDYEGEVTEGLDSVSEANGEDGEGEVCGGEEFLCCERPPTVSVEC